MKKTLLLVSLIAAGLTSQAQWLGQIVNSAASRGANHIAPRDKNVVWVDLYDGSGSAAAVQEVMKTGDGGTTWTTCTLTVASGAYGVANVTGLDTTTAWAAVYPSGAATAKQGIYKTVDGGYTWTKMTTGTVFGSSSFLDGVHFWDANNGFAFGDPVGGSYEIYTTTDGGSNWTAAVTSVTAQDANEYAYVGAFDVLGDHIWLTTNEGRILHSTDKGYNWTVASTTLTDANFVRFIDANTGFARQIDNANGINDVVITTDGGATWNPHTFMGNLFTSGMDFIPNTNILISTGADQTLPGTSFSIDGGLSWTDLETGVQRLDVNFITDSVGWTGGFSGGIGSEGMYVWDPSFNAQITSVKNNIEKGTIISVSPNPNNGAFTVDFRGIKGNNVTVKVTNMVGQEVYNNNISANFWIRKNIDLSGSEAGLYFVEVTDGSQSYITRVVIE